MARLFAATEVDPGVLSSRTIAIIGYGNQGRAQAINLRRGGMVTWIGKLENTPASQSSSD